jgi:hypothetical protein
MSATNINGTMEATNSQIDFSSSGNTCNFPQFKTTCCEEQPATVDVELKNPACLQELLLKDPTAFPIALKAAWALVLGCYTGQDDVSFGYQESRNLELISALTLAKITLNKATSIAHMTEEMRSSHKNRSSAAKAEFNTLLSLRNKSEDIDGKPGTSVMAEACEVGPDKVSLPHIPPIIAILTSEAVFSSSGGLCIRLKS